MRNIAAVESRTPGKRPIDGGATYSLRHRLFRIVWSLTWLVCASWTPRQLHPWRRFLLKSFGATMQANSDVRGSAKVWHPGHLAMDERATICEGVDVYNLAPISIGKRALVSQNVVLIGGGHNIDSPHFDLVTKPIHIGDGAWIAAGAVVGPGVTVHPYAVLGAYAVAFKDLDEGMVYAGNPARAIRKRKDWWSEGQS